MRLIVACLKFESKVRKKNSETQIETIVYSEENSQ